MMDRESARQAFLAAADLADGQWEPLAQDASTRRYFRRADKGLLLMDAPPPGEKPAAFSQVTRYLEDLGARVPRIHAADIDQGFILLEDLGDQTFTRLLNAGASAEPLYQLATDELIGFQRRCLDGTAKLALAPYDEAAALDEVALFADWYLPARLGRTLEPPERAEFLALWSEAFTALPDCAPVLVHRDFHVDNLLLVDTRCGLIDYQDALLGSPVYDLVSLLEDARRDVPPALRRSLLQHWRQAMSADGDWFEEHYAFWGAQRHCKVAGIFVRLWQRDGKPVYLNHLPRVMSLFSLSLQSSARLWSIVGWIEDRLGTVSHGEFSQDKD